MLVVDDDSGVRMMASAMLNATDGMTVVGEASDGVEAIDQVRRLQPDIVLMDVEMPRMDGPTATERIVSETPDVQVVAFTGSAGSESVVRMIVAGAKAYALKGSSPHTVISAIASAKNSVVHIDEAVVPALFGGVVQLAREEHSRRCEAERLQDELHSSYRQTVSALAAALDARDESTQEHVDRVTERAVRVAQELALSEAEQREVEYGALFHDVGKIAIPDSILKSSGPLSPEERKLIELHTVYGEEIVARVDFLRPVSRIVRHSHEHWDGSGYPDRLSGDDIPIGSRIVLACDAYDAMTAGRRYRPALTHAVAAANLRKDSGTQFDPRVAGALLRVLEREHVADPMLDSAPEKVPAGSS